MSVRSETASGSLVKGKARSLVVRWRRSLVGTVAVVALVLGVSSVAHAGVYQFCDANIGGGGSCTAPYFELLTAVSAVAGSSSYSTCAGATDGSGVYGNYICANDYSCHTYGGGVGLKGIAHNHESFTQHVYGTQWSSPSQPGSGTCPRGSYSLMAKAGASAPSLLHAPATADPPAQVFEPGDGRVCLSVKDVVGQGITCTSSERAASGQLALTLEPGDPPGSTGPILLVAYAPAGATTAVITDADGTRYAIEVQDGLAKAAVAAAAVSMTWENQSTQVGQPVQLP